jgi:hypothetical protein
MTRSLKAVFVANICVWVYFWLAFAHVSQPYDPSPGGHLPVDPASFWGHAIGLSASTLQYPFMKLVFWVDFPSFVLVTLFRRAFLSGVPGTAFFAGVSSGGYGLLAIMFLSFAQWYLVVWLVQKTWHRFCLRSTSINEI